MPRKVHAGGFRLGITQLYSIQLQCYGKTPHTYSLFILKIQKLSDLLNRICKKYQISLGNIEWTVKNSNLSCSTFYTSFKKLKGVRKSNKIQWVNKNSLKKNSRALNLVPCKAFNFWTNYNPINIRFYYVHWLHSPKTLTSWIHNQFEQHQPIKFILKLLKKELLKNRQWNYETKSFISGNVKFFLTGIRIKCCGRLRGKRQRMSNQINKQIGIMPLQTLNAFIEYERSSLCTRFSKIGVHVYYYYSKTKSV
uniref:ribosomal protein S3 n=1 Tax=Sahlingia subintegra TaxID=468936 RepID=UPI001FCD67A3|nr:ribosomal protein S3 [Sahlingia subintegra]UNJ19069.1 ribosomal protein S3 [Sahlingia subintegra]